MNAQILGLTAEIRKGTINRVMEKTTSTLAWKPSPALPKMPPTINAAAPTAYDAVAVLVGCLLSDHIDLKAESQP